MKASAWPALLAFSFALGHGPAAAAEPTERPKGYLQVGAVATSQPSGIANHRVTPAIGGSTIGIAAAGGFWVIRTLAIEGEFLGGRAVSTAQQFIYNWTEDFTGTSRDRFLGANLRWRPAAGTGRLEFHGGGGLAFSTFAERSIVRTDMFPTPRTSTLPDWVETATGPALNGGVAVALPAGSRIEIVPSFAVRWIRRSSDDLGDYLGVGSRAYQFGATVRFNVD